MPSVQMTNSPARAAEELELPRGVGVGVEK